MATKQREFKHRWLSALATSTDLDWDVRGLLLAIAERFMRPDGMNVWASQGAIAVECGGSKGKKNAVQRMLSEAQAAGWVRYEMRADHLGVDRLHLTPTIPSAAMMPTPESGSTSTPESVAATTPESGSEPRRVNPEVVEPVVAPSGEGPRTPRSARGPKPVGGTGVPDEELLISEDDAPPSHDPSRLDLAAVALAEPNLSRDLTAAACRIRDRLAVRNAAEVLDAVRSEDGVASDFVAVADLYRSLNTKAEITAANVVDLVDLARELLPDPADRAEALEQAARWSCDRYISAPALTLDGRLRKIAAPFTRRNVS